ncbi:hypothetical protein FOZ63_019159 [Perkinsus olseni]|uniref:Tyr recombinase domain-containing protein n=1 Tax=Perkinsus olseni TaxID=32597 RepID=A0A7J6RDU1_PEROL|nr:hypothetical protein FOZ63_019159 [Perkinsus olseni]
MDRQNRRGDQQVAFRIASSTEQMEDAVQELRMCVYIDAVVAMGEMQGDGMSTVDKANLRRIKRACVRGIGPDMGAKPISLDTLVKVRNTLQHGGARGDARSSAYLIAWWYVLRGAELIELRIKNVQLAHEQATIVFGVTKNDQKGEGCERTHRCACLQGVVESGCPVHAVRCLLDLRAKQRASPDDILFVNDSGGQWSQDTLRDTLRADLGNAGVEQSEQYTLHSFRVGGTQGMLKSGVSKESTKVFGRWRSNVIDRYAREAYIGDSESYAQTVIDAGKKDSHPRKERRRIQGETVDRSYSEVRSQNGLDQNTVGDGEKGVNPRQEGDETKAGSQICAEGESEASGWLLDPELHSSWLI